MRRGGDGKDHCYSCHTNMKQAAQHASVVHKPLLDGCTTCHDPHGVNGGSLANNYALINFDTTIVGPSSSGVLRFERSSEFKGSCYLTCHGVDHNPKSY